MGINKVQGSAALCSYDRLSTSDRFLIETISRVGRLSKKTTKSTTPTLLNLNFKETRDLQYQYFPCNIWQL